jgi:hypothetical protein
MNTNNISHHFKILTTLFLFTIALTPPVISAKEEKIQAARARFLSEMQRIVSTENEANNEPNNDRSPEIQARAKNYFSSNAWKRFERKQLKQLGNFYKEGLFYRSRQQVNQRTDRQLSAIEKISPADFWAENLREFLTNPSFKERRPAIYSYIQDHFQHDPFPETPRPINYMVDATSLSDVLTMKPGKITIDPKRVYQIHSLHAASTPNPMSFMGHAMFRLVICPEGAPLDKNCLKNADNDIVVSYRAHIEDTFINYAKGLLGGYPSKQFLMKFPDILDEYTQLEDRELLSLPINFTEAEKTAFIHKILEQNAEFEGDYKFLSENCATLSWGHLQCATSHKKVHEKNMRTPIGIHRALAKMGLTDKKLLRNRFDAISNGYYWPRISDQIAEDLNDLLLVDPAFPYRNAKTYLAAPTTQRILAFEKIFGDIAVNDPVIVRKKSLVLLSFLKMESHMAKRQFYQKLMRLQSLIIAGHQGKLEEEKTKAKDFYKIFAEIKEYAKELKGQKCSGGYGMIIPQDLVEVSNSIAQELIPEVNQNQDGDAHTLMIEDAGASKKEQIAQQALKFLQLIPQLTPELDQDINDIIAFIERLKILTNELPPVEEV